MNSDGLNERQLALFLQEVYKCENHGRHVPPPYCDEDDMPTLWRSPSGLFFYVPLPPHGGNYPQDHIELIIKTHKLNVVVGINQKPTPIETAIKQFMER